MKPDSIVAGFIDYLESDGKAEFLPDISHQLDQLVQEMDETKKAVVFTAVPLTDGEKESLKKCLIQIFQRDVETVENTVDRKLIGGLRIQLGDTLIDATILGQLNQLKRILQT